jgi:DNA-directed RNA polymerase I and III subunit RPAC1
MLSNKVPTIAIERVYVYNNTSVIHDEVLSHRLGLVPLHINPRIMDDAPTDYQNNSTDRNTIVFTLDVECTNRSNVKQGEQDPEKLYVNSNGRTTRTVDPTLS